MEGGSIPGAFLEFYTSVASRVTCCFNTSLTGTYRDDRVFQSTNYIYDVILTTVFGARAMIHRSSSFHHPQIIELNIYHNHP